MLLHGLKRAWSSSTVPPKIQEPFRRLADVRQRTRMGRNRIRENSLKQRPSFIVRRLELKSARLMGKSMNIVRYMERHLPDGWRSNVAP